MIEWLEERLRTEKQYAGELETQLIEAQVEAWLAREQLQMLGVDATLPLREAIIQLSKKLEKNHE